MTMATDDGTAVAVKVLDGNVRAARTAAVALLAKAGAITADAAQNALEAADTVVLGGGAPVGRLRPVV
jgi:L-asparaginase II